MTRQERTIEEQATDAGIKVYCDARRLFIPPETAEQMAKEEKYITQRELESKQIRKVDPQS
jgi:hypothetical protein